MNAKRGSLFTHITCIGILILLLGSPTANAQDVILNPGYISGSMSISGETINSGGVSASWTDPSTNTTYSASTNFSSSGNYTLTVNVPSGTTPNYRVYAYAYLSGSKQFSFASQTVAVSAGNTSTLNFNVSPGRIQGTVTATGGTPTAISLYAYDNAGFSSYGSSSGSTMTIPANPGTVSVYGYAHFQYASVYLSTQSVSVTAGGTVNVGWTATAPAPPQKGTITGTFQYTGSVTPTSVYVSASGSSSTPSNGSYTLTDVYTGSQYVYASASFSQNRYFGFPDSSFAPSRTVAVNAGQTSTVNISATQSYLTGTVALTGTKTFADVSSFGFNAYGAQNTPAYGGYAGQSFSNPPGAPSYSLVVSSGGWSPYYFNFYFNSQASGLNENLYFYDYERYRNPISIAAGETKTHNIILPTGLVTVNFVALSGTFSYPYLSGSCYKRNQSNEVLSYGSFNSYGQQQNVATAQVSFAAMAGMCTIDAWAQVGPSYTKFGTFNVEVVPGTTQVVDINGPTLTVQQPAPDSVTSAANITVTGKANNEVVDIASVTVNGVSATLTSTNNASQPHEVSFVATIPLAAGANQIQTIATATSNKTASDTRTVYRDNGPPVLNWTPADGAVVTSNSVVISGTATDDAGVKSVTVNGNTVSITPGTSVSFNFPMTLANGSNVVTVVATDSANQTTSQTHNITVGTDVVPPVTSLSQNGTLGNGGWFTSNVTISLSATDNAGGSGVDRTEYNLNNAGWMAYSSPFSVSTLGTSTVLYRSIDKAGNTETAKSATVKVDKAGPMLTGMPAGNCSLWPVNHKLVLVATISASDTVSGVPPDSLVITATSNQPVNTTGDGNSNPDIVINGGNVQLRAERSGNNEARIYTITASASDLAGNKTTATATCVVPHDQGN